MNLFYEVCMDWDRAIERNREPLLRIVAALFAMIGLAKPVKWRDCLGRSTGPCFWCSGRRKRRCGGSSSLQRVEWW